MSTGTIRTEFVYPPIPIRHHDWVAYIDGNEEFGPYGWGETEAEAIKDLKEQLEAKRNLEGAPYTHIEPEGFGK